MAHEQNSSAVLSRDLVHFSERLFLKFGVADGQHFVDKQDLRLKMCCDSERKPDVHSRRIMLDWCIEELFDFGERNDLVELPPNFPLSHAEDGAVEENVLPPRQFWVETCADLEQAGDASAQFNPPLGRLGDSAEDLEQRAFASAIAADHAENFPLLDIEANVFERPEFLDLISLYHLTSTD